MVCRTIVRSLFFLAFFYFRTLIRPPAFCQSLTPLGSVVMTLTNVVLGQIYGKQYTGAISTRLSNSLTVGTILGQLGIGIVCDLYGRKHGIVISTFCIVAGIIIVTAAHGAHESLQGFFWCFTIGRGLTGIGVGGEYPSSSASAAEAANEKMLKSRGPVFILVTVSSSAPNCSSPLGTSAHARTHAEPRPLFRIRLCVHPLLDRL